MVNGLPVTIDCTVDDVCGTNNITAYAVKESIYSLNNWIEQLNLYCTDGKYIGMIGALAFLGSAIACGILPILGDKIGRLPVFLITQAIQIPMFLVAIYTTSLGMVFFIVFFLGFCLIGRFTCGFVLFVELLPEKNKALAGAAILIGYSISLLEVTIYYAFISQNSVPTIWFGLAFNIVTFIANFMIPESPMWLVTQGRYEDARKGLKRIAAWNRVAEPEFDPFVEELKALGIKHEVAAEKKKPSEVEAEEEESQADMLIPKEGEQESKPLAVLDGEVVTVATDPNITFCNHKSIRNNLIVYCFMWSISSFNYYLIFFAMKYLSGSIYVNTTASAISENSAYVVSGILLNKIGIKACYVCALIIAIIGGFLLTVYSDAGALEAVFVFIARFGICWSFNNCYLSTPLLFPSHLRVRTFGIVHLLASFVTVLAPLIAEIHPPIPMLLFTLLSAFIMGMSFCIDTKKRYQ